MKANATTHNPILLNKYHQAGFNITLFTNTIGDYKYLIQNAKIDLEHKTGITESLEYMIDYCEGQIKHYENLLEATIWEHKNLAEQMLVDTELKLDQVDISKYIELLQPKATKKPWFTKFLPSFLF